jgi:hypothetical protein
MVDTAVDAVTHSVSLAGPENSWWSRLVSAVFGGVISVTAPPPITCVPGGQATVT